MDIAGKPKCGEDCNLCGFNSGCKNDDMDKDPATLVSGSCRGTVLPYEKGKKKGVFPAKCKKVCVQ
jgi:hypothetical protein